MKKILTIITIIILFAGCTLDDIDNTPTKQVEAFFNNYQTLDKKVLADLDLVIEKQTDFNNKQKEKYRKILKKHYQNLNYEIKNETVNGDRSNVEVELEVTDFNKALKEANDYLENNKNKFLDESNNISKTKYIDYQLEKLEKAKDTVKYTLNLTVTKNKNGDWKLEEINDIEEKKILGTYEY